MKDNIFKNDAKGIVDLCFDNKLFKEEVTRDGMIGFEDLIEFTLQSRFDSYMKATKLFDSIKELKIKENK